MGNRAIVSYLSLFHCGTDLLTWPSSFCQDRRMKMMDPPWWQVWAGVTQICVAYLADAIIIWLYVCLFVLHMIMLNLFPDLSSKYLMSWVIKLVWKKEICFFISWFSDQLLQEPSWGIKKKMNVMYKLPDMEHWAISDCCSYFWWSAVWRMASSAWSQYQPTSTMSLFCVDLFASGKRSSMFTNCGSSSSGLHESLILKKSEGQLYLHTHFYLRGIKIIFKILKILDYLCIDRTIFRPSHQQTKHITPYFRCLWWKIDICLDTLLSLVAWLNSFLMLHTGHILEATILFISTAMEVLIS